VVVRTITCRDTSPLVQELQEAHFGVTTLDAEGAKGPVKLVFTVVRRKELDGVLGIVRRFDPQAFYSVDEIQETAQGVFPARRRMTGLIPSVLQPSRLRLGRQ
jgi:uncharacterized protein YebE (UPF0316 family)